MKKLFFLIIVLSLAYFLYYMGAFLKISAKTENHGPLVYAYVDHVGDYAKVTAPMNELDKKLRDVGFNPTVGIGVYFDNPKLVEKAKLRSEVGSVIPTKELAMTTDQKHDFKFKVLEQKEYVAAEFPYHNFLSFMIAVIKVYPVMNKYLADNKLQSVPSIELYDMANNKITFLMEVKK